MGSLRLDIPSQEPRGPRLNQQQAGQDSPVHQPWRQLGRVGRLEGLVAGEEREEERGDGAVVALLSGLPCQFTWESRCLERGRMAAA